MDFHQVARLLAHDDHRRPRLRMQSKHPLHRASSSRSMPCSWKKGLVLAIDTVTRRRKRSKNSLKRAISMDFPRFPAPTSPEARSTLGSRAPAPAAAPVRPQLRPNIHCKELSVERSEPFEAAVEADRPAAAVMQQPILLSSLGKARGIDHCSTPSAKISIKNIINMS